MDWNTYLQVDGAESGGQLGKPAYPLPSSVVQPSYGAQAQLVWPGDGYCLTVTSLRNRMSVRKDSVVGPFA